MTLLWNSRALNCRRLGGAVAGLQNLRRLCTGCVELIDPCDASCSGMGGQGGRPRLISITEWLLNHNCMWGPGAGLWRTLRVLKVTDHHGLDWGVLGAQAACLSQLQVLLHAALALLQKAMSAEVRCSIRLSICCPVASFASVRQQGWPGIRLHRACGAVPGRAFVIVQLYDLSDSGCCKAPNLSYSQGLLPYSSFPAV